MKQTDSIRAAIAARIRQARELSGLSQRQVADPLRLHRPAVSEIEAGRRKVTAEELKTMADIFGVSLEWLTGEKQTAGTTSTKIRLAARHLENLASEDLDRVLELIESLSTGNEAPDRSV